MTMFVYLLLLLNAAAMDHFVSQEYADLSFGCRQVEQVICDQPDMGETISHDAFLRQMLVCQFAGASGKGRVYWDCREPESGRPAEHFGLLFGYPAMVRVSKTNGGSPTDKCASLVFELFNLQVDEEVELLKSAEATNRKSRKEFALQCVRLEFEAGKKAQAYFQEHPMMDVRSWRDPFYCSIEFIGDFSSYLRYLDENKDVYDARKYFGEMYDNIVSPKKVKGR